MSSQPPAPPPNDADKPTEDWAMPGDTTGSWEGDEARPAREPAPPLMSPATNRAEDWALPGDTTGSWEGDGARPAGAPAPAPSMVDSVRAPLVALWADPRSRPLVLLSGAGVIGVCALACFVLALAALANRGPDTPPPLSGTATAVASRPVTSSISLSVSVAGTPAPNPAPGIPNRLQVGGRAYTVNPVQLSAKNEWTYDREAQKTAFWAAGTQVNYVIGLHNSTDNRTAFEALKIGDLLVLDTGAGQFRYRVTTLTSLKVDDAAPLREQSSPQITLLLLGDTSTPNQRRAVFAKYTDEGSPNVLVSIGAPINLVDLRVRATNPRLLEGSRVGLPAGRNYYQVDIEIFSLLTRTLETGTFAAELIDGSGARYPLSTQAAFASGGKGWASGSLAPGSTINVTAGFDVPASMAGPKIELNFSADASNAFVARVSIPFRPVIINPTAAPTAAPAADVDLLAVNLSPEGNEVRIVGQIRNLTSRDLAVSPRDVSLTGNGTPVALNAALPGFPWTIPSNETLAFQLNFSRPPAGNVIFTLFGRSYQIDGL
ncbi:MAG: hypothetical protein ABIQ99_08265 [Thermoflexales bacterium]